MNQKTREAAKEFEKKLEKFLMDYAVSENEARRALINQSEGIEDFDVPIHGRNIWDKIKD